MIGTRKFIGIFRESGAKFRSSCQPPNLLAAIDVALTLWRKTPRRTGKQTDDDGAGSDRNEKKIGPLVSKRAPGPSLLLLAAILLRWRLIQRRGCPDRTRFYGGR